MRTRQRYASLTQMLAPSVLRAKGRSWGLLFLAFLALFSFFELFHPVSDLKFGTGSLMSGEASDMPCGTHGSGDTAGDAHGPYLQLSTADSIRLLDKVVSFQDETSFLPQVHPDPPSHVPIS